MNEDFSPEEKKRFEELYRLGMWWRVENKGASKEELQALARRLVLEERAPADTTGVTK